MTLTQKIPYVLIALVTLTALFTLLQPASAQGSQECCFNNFRFAGGCTVRPAEGTTCGEILSYLNNLSSVGGSFCGNTTVRGGWTQVSCVESGITPGGAKVQQRQPNIKVQESNPSTGLTDKSYVQAKSANLINVSLPLDVRLDEGLDSSSQAAGQVVTGRLEQDLVSGGAVIAPKGSKIQATLVPTSFWSDGAGDAYQIQLTGVTVDDQVVPISGTATQAEGMIATTGTSVQVPEGSLVHFKTEAATDESAAEEALEQGTVDFMNAFNTGNANALASVYASNAVLLPPNAPAVFGRDGIRAANEKFLAVGNLEIELEDLEIVVEGNLGYKAGRYRIKTTEGVLVDRGKYIEIWDHADGKWMLHRDIYNSSMPAAPAEEVE